LPGTLYLCPTPIGNLDDITLRVIKILKEVDLIAAEDTKHSIKLLNYHKINNKLTSYYEYNKHKKGQKLINYLISGMNIALITDAGTPGISDPGEELVKLCLKKSIKIISIPGACALTTALVASGLPSGRFCFEGFLSINKKNRLTHLNNIKNENKTLIFYEAPHKLFKTLEDMKLIFGNRKIVIAREITKKFEEFIQTTIEEALNYFKKIKPKGEFVVIVHGANKNKNEEIEENLILAKKQIHKMLSCGTYTKDIVNEVRKKFNLNSKEIYSMCLNFKKDAIKKIKT
jgi:16S rRNA (cytidine1402-2'-O)-methyltransferase